MTEKINLKADEAAVKVLLASMVAAERKGNGRRREEWKAALLVDVKLTVNGIEVPFLDTLREILDNEYSQQTRLARDMAIVMLSDAGLMPALEALREANVKIARLMGKVAAAIPDT